MTTQPSALLQRALDALNIAAPVKLADGTYLDKDCKITMAITAIEAAIAQPEPATLNPGAGSAASLADMVDAAMVEMANIHPPLRRRECERLIRAATASSYKVAQPAESLTEQRLMNLARAAKAALPQLCDTSSRGQAERVALEEAIAYAGLAPYGESIAQPAQVGPRSVQEELAMCIAYFKLAQPALDQCCDRTVARRCAGCPHTPKQGDAKNAGDSVVGHIGAVTPAMLRPLTADDHAKLKSALSDVFGWQIATPQDATTDAQSEGLFLKSREKWDGDVWRFEDADLHPFVRTVITNPRDPK